MNIQQIITRSPAASDNMRPEKEQTECVTMKNDREIENSHLERV